MSDANELVDARDEALRKIGRNVVKFQKMEAMLRFLAAHGSHGGPLKDITNIRRKISRSLANKPKGILADAFVRTAYASGPDTDESEIDSDEVQIFFTFRMAPSAETGKERREALKEIVAERKKLIHQWLTDFDPESAQSCKELSKVLDEQRARICAGARAAGSNG